MLLFRMVAVICDGALCSQQQGSLTPGGGESQGSLLEDMTPQLNPEGHTGVRVKGWAGS